MSNDIEMRVRKIIKESLESSDAMDQLGLEDDLGTLGLNSISFIKIVVAIEGEFSIEFDDESLDFSNFKTFGNVISCIQEKLNN